MTIKSKISLYTSLFFSVLYGLISVFIVNDFSNFRKEEFEDRLKEKAVSTIKLLIEVKDIDKHVLKIIDQNSINKLFNEKTLVFDTNYNLIYSSLDDSKINWTIADLEELKKNKTFFKNEGQNEIYGFFYDSNTNDYFALISADDSIGKRKLNYLITLIFFSGIAFLLITWVVTFYIIRNQLLPLDVFHKKIKEINLLDLQTPLNTKPNSNNEIDLLGHEFNAMIALIRDAYQKQKEFTAHASHEFRTPLTRISTQIENQLNTVGPKEKTILKNILNDVDKLNELISSLLLLSRIDSSYSAKNEKVRIDEVIYKCIEKVTKEFSDCKINLQFDEIDHLEELLEINSNSNLLEIAFYNLFKNAYLYSSDKCIAIDIVKIDTKIGIKISNKGNVISAQEQLKLFEPFVRGENAKHKKGLGLGLKICDRILGIYDYKISYQSMVNMNIFTVKF